MLLLAAQANADPSLRARQLLGPPVDLPARVEVSRNTLDRSQGARRQQAWDIVRELFAAIRLRDQTESQSYAMPRWLGWSQGSEYGRLMDGLWSSLSDDQRRARGPLADADILGAYERDWRELRDSEMWSEPAYQELRAEALSDPQALLGVNALGRNYFSPSLIRSYFTSYASVSACADQLLRGASSDVRCFDVAHPRDAVAVKAIWRLESLGLPVYDTDAASLARLLAPASDGEWVPVRMQKGPALGALRVRRGDRVYALVGLHVMTKALDDWMWATLWWSPDAERDFGEDRPAAWAREGLAYKLCAVSGFDEPAGSNDLPSGPGGLRSALDAASAGAAGAQWCSNPYIETGRHNARTGCIGCHQFAGRSLKFGAEQVLAMPGHGVHRALTDPPADYLWTFASDPARLGLQTYDLTRPPSTSTPRQASGLATALSVSRSSPRKY